VAADLSRRRFLAGAGAAAGLAGLGLASCSGGGRRPAPTTAPSSTVAGPRPIRIGYVAEITGPNSFRGEFTTSSLDALTGYVDDKLGGTYKGLAPKFVPADAPTGANGRAAYRELLTKNVAAILWCTPFGLIEALSDIQSGSVPVLSVLADPYSVASRSELPLTGSGAKGMTVFQTMLPDTFAFDVMMAYASEDRVFTSAGLLYDTAAYPRADSMFVASTTKYGLANQGVFAYDSASSHVDLAGPLNALKHAGADVVVCYGLADQASVVATQLQELDAKYVDTTTTRQSHFKPMLMGSAWGTGDPSFARLAGDAVARGTIAATALAGVLTLPSMPIRDWLHAYVAGYNGGFLRGGEEGPASAAVAVLDAASRAGSTASGPMISALEAGVASVLTSSVGVSFTGDRHLAVSSDDVALLTVELPPAPYNLGTEWREVLPNGYRGPTHLVDFTLAANTRAHPEVMQQILQRRYGTSASNDYQADDRTKVAACKAVH
jgi:ABC-type branched-subunit amino acid transport system substrate-binding protein